MDELIDILTIDGAPTGKTAMKSEAHRKGLFHSTVHIWFYTKNGEILLQKRSQQKDIHPSLWDVSVAGHIGAGEANLAAAIREVQEEIGLRICEKQLLKIGVFKSVQKYSDQLIDCEFHHTYLSELTVPIIHLTKQPSEVDELILLPVTQFQQDIKTPEMANTYVPHDKRYYTTILREIKKLL